MAYLMIVDDDEDFADATAMVLRQVGHEVRTHQDIASAVKSMTEKPPDLLILDVMFPEDSAAGFELARTLHSDDDRLKDIPILMLTAINAKFPLGFNAGDIDEAWLPVSDFLEKPVDFEVLKEKVAGLLESTASGEASA
jgi:CheY-like chemotaxis protein